MKNNGAPKVRVIHVLNNILCRFFEIGEFSGMGEFILHATKFPDSSLAPRFILFLGIKLGRNRQPHCPSLYNPPFAISTEVIPFPAAEIIRLSSYLLELSPILFASLLLLPI